MSGLRVGLIGARRVRQGLGPFIARDLLAHGAQIPVVLGTTTSSSAEAASGIERLTGFRPEATRDRDEFYERGLDAVCVLTPAGTHIEFVNAALERGLHVLCEKPVFWHPDTGDWGERARELEDRFESARLVLAVNTQWPWTLEAFRALYPSAEFESSTRLEMGLAPASKGSQMIGDALPHPLSLAQALRPGLSSVTNVRFERSGADSLRVRATLADTTDGSEFALEVRLAGDAQEMPREAWYAIDGMRADRCVRSSDYAMFLRSGARLVDLADPLRLRVGSFLESVERARRGEFVHDRLLSNRACMLQAIDRAFRDR